MHRALVLLSLVTALLWAPATRGGESATRWSAATPDAQLALAERAARQLAASDDAEALARALMIHSLDEQASAGAARAALRRLAQGDTTLAHEARWLARWLTPDDGEKLDAAPSRADAGARVPGLIGSFAILGPFQDHGGGLARKEGPETPNHDFTHADYSWGVYAVRYQRSLRASVTARGVPLDLYIHPRTESCSYLSSAVRVPGDMTFVLRVAASGSFRLRWDGHDVATAEETQTTMLLDRIAARVVAKSGEHLLTIKSCSGSRPDDGRVRVHVTDERGHDLKLASSSDLAGLQRLRQRLRGGAPPQVTLIDTPLSKALSVGDAPTPRRALIAALVRTLAGADDSRATKAPGLLDRVVEDAHTRADALAMAGRLAPFGANRSGWLMRAMVAAEREGDADAKAYAQRLLVASRLQAHLFDLARSSAAEPPLGGARDAQARWLRAQSYASSRAPGLTRAGERMLLDIVREQGAKTPLVVWRALATTSSGVNPARTLQARKLLAEARVSERTPTYLAAYRMMGADTLEALAMGIVLQQDSAAEVMRIGGMLQDAGRYPAAARVLSLAASLAPNRADAQQAWSAIQLLTSKGPADAGLAGLARASELEPREAALHAELDFRRGKAERGPTAGEDAAYLVEPEVFLKRAREQPAPPDGMFERQLHWRRVVRYHADKRVSQLMHYAREILVEPRTEGERYENLPDAYNSELLLARVHKKDGSVVPPEEEDASGPMVRWPKLERGDVVEIAVRSWTPGPVGRRGDPPFYFVDYVGGTDTRPVLYNEVILDAPSSAPLSFDVVGGKADRRTQETKDGRRITRLIWDHPPTLPDEPWTPPLSELMPVVVGSAYASWDEFLDWYRGAVEGFTQPDEQIKRLAEQLTEGKQGREQKVEALFNFVSDDIRYVNFVSGEWWLPNRPQQLLARRQGDCDDKAMLLISLLKAEGIDAEEVLIQTRMTRQRAVMRSAKVAIPMFDHGIVFLPDGKGGGRYLDATSPQSRLGVLPSMDSGAMALVVEPNARIVETPPPAAADHGISAQWTMDLQSSGAGRVVADERHVGDAAFMLRNQLGEEDARAQWIEQSLVGDWFPSLTVDPKVSFDDDLPGGNARVRYQLESRSMARREGTDLVVALAPPTPLTAMLAPLTSRKLPVELPPQLAPTHRDMTLTIRAPATHRFADLPPDGVADGGSFGRAEVTLKLSADKRSVVAKRTVSFAQYRIEPADYGRWRSWLQSIDRLLQRSVRLVKK